MNFVVEALGGLTLSFVGCQVGLGHPVAVRIVLIMLPVRYSHLELQIRTAEHLVYNAGILDYCLP